MKRHILSIGAALVVCGAQAALAAQLSVLSAGAIEPGIRPALAEFEKASSKPTRWSSTAHRPACTSKRC